MRRLAAALALVALAAGEVSALTVPPRTDRYVNDYAEIIAPADEQALESFLASLDRGTSNQIVVVTLASLEGLTAEEVTLRFADAWKPGRADKDNGVVVGVYPNDREARIEVGYGLEGAIPDAVASSILRNDMIPAFRTGDWSTGIAAGVRSLAAAASGEYQIPSSGPGGRAWPAWLIVLVILVLFGVWGLMGFASLAGGAGYGPRGRYRGSHWGGGGFGGRGGGGFGGFGGGGGFSGGGSSGSF